MTKRRDPVTVEQALVKIAAIVEFDGMAAALSIDGRTVRDRTVRDWADPDVQTRLTLDDAIALDIAYQQAGGIGAPLLELHALRVDEARAAAFASQYRLAERVIDGVREDAEATAATLVCTLPGADPADFRSAIRETEEAIASKTNTLVLLRQGAGPCQDGRVPGVS